MDYVGQQGRQQVAATCALFCPRNCNQKRGVLDFKNTRHKQPYGNLGVLYFPLQVAFFQDAIIPQLLSKPSYNNWGV